VLTRAAQDRSLAEGARLLRPWTLARAASRDDRVLPAHPHSRARSPGRRERDVCLALRFGRVSLRRPATADSRLAASVDAFVVDLTGVDPPPGVEPLHWRLLTTHEVTTVAEAQEIVRWYRLR
jgi:hypothetical protein